MFKFKFHLRSPNRLFIKLSLEVFFYVLLTIFFFLMYFYISDKYTAISNELSSSENTKSGKYYVHTSQCQMPYVNPFTEPILKNFRPIKYENCTRNIPLYTSTFNQNSKTHIMQLNKDLVLKYFPQIANSKPNDLKCRYNEIVRHSANDSFGLVERQNLPEKFIVPRRINAMMAWCKLKSTGKVVYSDSFTFVHYKYTRAKKKPGVLLIGIDSLSRTNLRRVMPKTYGYLKSTWFELEGYNKVGDNTFPNLMPLLTGYNLTEALDKCRPTVKGGLNSPQCNLIWNSFRKFGYRTAYAEDAAEIGTFNFMKKGFYEQPTLYYFRPTMLASSTLLKAKFRHGRKFCIGHKHAGEYIYDYAQQLAKVYGGENLFGLFWTKTFSHDRYDDPSMIDDQMMEYFKSFQKDGILDSAIVIFFSDSGSRSGELLKLPEAFFEERLPTFFISLPKSFKQKYPNFVKALQVNRNRLTSPYDIHMTLNHILELYEPNLKLPDANGCKKCQSIFRSIPESRTCLDAGITDHWCTCSKYERVYTKSRIVHLHTMSVIRIINKYLKANNKRKCIELKLHKILQINLKVGDYMLNQKQTYRIKFNVLPFKDIFEATFSSHPKNSRINLQLENISRLTQMVPPTCIENSGNIEVASKFCVCRSYINMLKRKGSLAAT